MKCVKCYLLTTIATLCILVLSLVPIPEMPEMETVPLADKWAHFLMYGGLLMAVWLDWIRNGVRPTMWNAVVAVVFGVALGGLIELIQPYVMRSCEVLDFVADSIGAVLGCLVGWLLFVILSLRAKSGRDSR